VRRAAKKEAPEEAAAKRGESGIPEETGPYKVVTTDGQHARRDDSDHECRDTSRDGQRGAAHGARA